MQRPILHGLTSLCVGSGLFLCAVISSAVSQSSPVRLDSSDWWSYTRREELPSSKPNEPLKVRKREPTESTFQIGGIALREPGDFSEIRSKFGAATEVERGDAASGRNQICYTSPSGSVHLIFEFGEVDSVLYLFDDGPRWNGSEFCAPSNKVSEKVSTASGLRLGIGRQQVKNVLGEPSIDTPDRLVYYFDYRKRSTPKELVELRKKFPDMNEEEFVKNFEFADGEAYIKVRFASEKLNYLAISKSETY
jgi:hypothetical protein